MGGSGTGLGPLSGVRHGASVHEAGVRREMPLSQTCMVRGPVEKVETDVARSKLAKCYTFTRGMPRTTAMHVTH